MLSIRHSLEAQAHPQAVVNTTSQATLPPVVPAHARMHMRNDNDAYLLALGHEEHLSGDLDLTLGNLRGHL